MNKVFLIGRLTQDPEIRYAQNENSTAIARFSIAVDRRFKRDGEPTADFFNCTAFGKTAEFVEKYLHKGSKIAIVGHIQNNNYTNKNGEKVYSIQIMVDEIEFAESKGAGDSTNQSDASGQPSVGSNGFVDINSQLEEELPF